MTTHRISWIGIDDPSRTDDARVVIHGDGMRASGSSLTATYATGWALDVDELWQTRRIDVTASGPGWSRHLSLMRSTSGAWSSETLTHGNADLPAPGIEDGTDLEEAVDCDLGRCPLTNLMPIRRLGLLQENVAATPLVMAWIEVPSLRVLRSDQEYGSGSRAGLVRYTSHSRGFDAEIEVDGDGFVVRYPDLARRVATGA